MNVRLLTLCSALALVSASAHAQESATESGSESESDSESGSEPEPEPVAEPEPEPEPESEGRSFRLPGLGQTAFSMTSTSTARYRGQNYDANPFDDSFASVQQRLDLTLQADELRAELRLDGFLPFIEGTFSDGSRCPEGSESLCLVEADVRPERFLVD